MSSRATWVIVAAFLGAMIGLAPLHAQPTATDIGARRAPGHANPSEAQARAAADLDLIFESAEREARIEAARRIAPIDLWFGLR